MTIKIFNPGNAICHRRVHVAPAGRYVTDEGLDRIIEDTADEIEQRMPGHEYRLVELAEHGCFNFVWVSGPPAPEFVPETTAASA